MDIDKPYYPPVEEVGEGIVRINCGHDSNFEKELVIKSTAKYKHRFFNTSIPRFDFPAPVVFTANKEEEKPVPLFKTTGNLMFVRLRVSSTNLPHIKSFIVHRTGFPIVLTFMAYYEEPPDKINYEWKIRHINPYWCAKRGFIANTIREMKKLGGRWVSLCGTLESNYCKDCRNCETYYWQTIKHLKERNRNGKTKSKDTD